MNLIGSNATPYCKPIARFTPKRDGIHILPLTSLLDQANAIHTLAFL